LTVYPRWVATNRQFLWTNCLCQAWSRPTFGNYVKYVDLLTFAAREGVIPLQTNRIIRGDCVKKLSALEPASVDLAFADPPFNINYEYDVYKDNKDYESYVEWTGQWMGAVCRALKPNGTFWVAIGDEYAAEVKMIAQQQLGLTCRSWVIWYYTFGVNCTKKFNRSHAHLFHFIKDPENFTFNDSDIRVPSARQLVYADARANPKGRLPDDTWVLRPQDLPQGFAADQDTWYFPRVAGTFKERAGFHGCQMPEQLLGRIVRACSNPDDVVLDPFAGSGTTLVVAKKLGRSWLGIELSDSYAKAATKRIKAADVGQDLEGAAEPLVSAPSTASGKQRGRKSKSTGKSKKTKAADRSSAPKVDADKALATGRKTNKPGQRKGAAAVADDSDDETTPGQDVPDQKLVREQGEPKTDSVRQKTTAELGNDERAIIDAFTSIYDGRASDHIIADPQLNAAFIQACIEHEASGKARDWNRRLLKLRKSGRLPHLEAQRVKVLSPAELDRCSFASEIAWSVIAKETGATLAEILCDPQLAARFDKAAARWAPGFSAYQYRWTALRIRKWAKQRRKCVPELPKRIANAPEPDAIALKELVFDKVPVEQGVYVLRGNEDQALYVGETSDLQRRLADQLNEKNAGLVDLRRDHTSLSVSVLTLQPSDNAKAQPSHRYGLQSRLIDKHHPALNISKPAVA